jgi:hypothetical protein
MQNKILQCGYMSGDTYAAAALLAARPEMRLLLVKDRNAPANYTDKSTQIMSVYEASGVKNQVIEIDITGQGSIEALWKDAKERAKMNWNAPDKMSEDPLVKQRVVMYFQDPVGWPRLITAVTGFLASIWNDATRKTVAKAWNRIKLPDEQLAAVEQYIATVFAGSNVRNNIVVLWSRQSGKHSGAHLELDSSYTGIRQLAYEFAEKRTRATVLLAGDERNHKMEDFAKNWPNVFNVTDMWNDPFWKKAFGESSFLGQLAFYQCLREKHNVVHVGMRSGMLEAMALLGMEVFYLEGETNGSGNRMVAFSNAGITYTRVKIHCAPSISGYISETKRKYSVEQLEKFFRINVKKIKDRDDFETSVVKLGMTQREIDGAARRLVKFQSLPGKDLDKITPKLIEELSANLENNRGFYQDSLATIVATVSQKLL